MKFEEAFWNFFQDPTEGKNISNKSPERTHREGESNFRSDFNPVVDLKYKNVDQKTFLNLALCFNPV